MASAVVDSIGIEDNALETLYATFAEPLRRFCRSRLEGRQDEAEDACHETLLRASKALPGFRAGEPLWPWLATIAANVCKDMTRNDRRFGQLDADIVDLSATPEDEFDRRDRAAIVVAAMGAVPLHYRKALYLREWEDLSWADIARLEGKSVASVRSTLMRARRHLRSSIRQEAERVHQWPLPTVVPRGWVRSWAGFRDRAKHWYASSPERTLALLPLPQWLDRMIAGGGAAIAEGGVALLLAVGAFQGSIAAAPPPSPGDPGAGGLAVSAAAKVDIDLGGGGFNAGLQASIGSNPPEPWWFTNEPMAMVPVGDGRVDVVTNSMTWGEDRNGDGSVEYEVLPGAAVVVTPPTETGVERNQVISDNGGFYCEPPERRTSMMVLTCDVLERT